MHRALAIRGLGIAAQLPTSPGWRVSSQPPLGPAGYAGLMGRAGHFFCNPPDHSQVKDARHDVVLVQVAVGHPCRYGVSGCQLHLLVDLPGADIQCAPEDAGEAEGVIDLVGVV